MERDTCAVFQLSSLPFPSRFTLRQSPNTGFLRSNSSQSIALQLIIPAMFTIGPPPLTVCLSAVGAPAINLSDLYPVA